MGKTYLRSFYLSLLIIFCIGFIIFGITRVYKAVNATAFAKYDRAFSVDDEGIKILDFYIKKNKK